MLSLTFCCCCYCFNTRIVPMGFLTSEIWAAFPGESQLQQSCATQPMVHARCFSHNSPNSDMDYRIFNMHTDVNAQQGECVDTVCICTESKLWEKIPMPQLGIEPVSAACRSNILPTELHPHPSSLILLTAKCGGKTRKGVRACKLTHT